MKPILFNTDMVKAILEERKTVTRRIIKGFIPGEAEFGYTMFTPQNSISCRGKFGEIRYDSEQYGEKFFKLPYKNGDILYVRETWQCLNPYTDKWYIYKATPPELDNIKWRPSIHMPKEAARIFLKVTEVRVERLSDMTVNDMIAEGINIDGLITTSGIIVYRVINRWEELWDSTIKKSELNKYGRDANPWVWIIEFEKISKEVAYEQCLQ